MRLTTPLARARGSGSAKDGTHHWWAQRITAVALVPLSVWLVAALIGLVSGDYETARVAMGNPVNAALWILFIACAFHHGQLGLQVVIEDYLHDERSKIASIIAVKLLAVLLGTICILAVLRAAIGS